MAYGSKNNRKKILDSIVEGADGGSIMEGIEYAIQSEDNRSRGRGAASAAKSLEDTYQNVSSMKRSLGEKPVYARSSVESGRAQSKSTSSVAKDWMTILTGQAQSDKPDNDIKFSQQFAERMANPQTADDKYLVTGVPPTVQAKRSDINSALEEAIGTDTSLTQSPDSINTDEKRAEDAQYLSGSGLSIDDRFPDDETATPGFMSRPATPDYLASSDSTLEANIKEVQSLLGFTGREVDGNFGKNSKKELKAFQKRAGLPVTDNFTYDPATVEALKKANANIETATQGFLDKVAYGEGAKAGDETDYEIVYGQGTVDYLAPEIDGISTSPSGSPNRPLKITEMTFAQLYNYQNKMITGNTGKIRGKTAEGKGSSAAGKYQITRDSLFGKNGTPENPKANSWAGILKLDENTVFTPEIQERIGRLALKQSGFYNWLYNKNGGKSESNMLNGVARIWASVEGSTADQGTQTTQASLEPYLKVLRNRGVSD